MDRTRKKVFWLIMYVPDLAASLLVKEEMQKLSNEEIDIDYEDIQFIWIGFIKSFLLHMRLKKYGVISMFHRVNLQNSIWT